MANNDVVLACLVALAVLAAVAVVLAGRPRGDRRLSAALDKVDPGATSGVDLYEYRGEEVLYVAPSGCDMFNTVYRLSGEKLGAPSGGITGRGDGRLPEWDAQARYVRTLRRAGEGAAKKGR